MITAEQITQMVASGIQDSLELYIASNGLTFDEGDPNKPKIIVCSERSLTQDEYSKHVIIKNDDQQIDLSDIRWKNTIFAVVSFSQGNSNFAVSQNTITIQAISEGGDFQIAFNTLRLYVNRVNFRTKEFVVNGNSYSVIQTFNNPDISEAQMLVFASIRSLVILRGVILIKEPTLDAATITGIDFSFGTGDWGSSEIYKLPFISGMLNCQQTPEPQAFPHETYGPASNIYDKGGWTSAKNRQSTLTITITAYLGNWATNGDKLFSIVDRLAYLNDQISNHASDYNKTELISMNDEVETLEYAKSIKLFSKYIIDTVIKNHDFNIPIHIRFETNNIDGEEEKMYLVDSFFIPVSETMSFQWGQFSLPNFVFSETDPLV